MVSLPSPTLPGSVRGCEEGLSIGRRTTSDEDDFPRQVGDVLLWLEGNRTGEESVKQCGVLLSSGVRWRQIAGR